LLTNLLLLLPVRPGSAALFGERLAMFMAYACTVAGGAAEPVRAAYGDEEASSSCDALLSFAE
jgi:hypothetical protein